MKIVLTLRFGGTLKGPETTLHFTFIFSGTTVFSFRVNILLPELLSVFVGLVGRIEISFEIVNFLNTVFWVFFFI